MSGLSFACIARLQAKRLCPLGKQGTAWNKWSPAESSWAWALQQDGCNKIQLHCAERLNCRDAVHGRCASHVLPKPHPTSLTTDSSSERKNRKRLDFVKLPGSKPNCNADWEQSPAQTSHLGVTGSQLVAVKLIILIRQLRRDELGVKLLSQRWKKILIKHSHGATNLESWLHCEYGPYLKLLHSDNSERQVTRHNGYSRLNTKPDVAP